MDEDADENINRVNVRRSRLVEDTFQNTLVEYTVFDSVNNILDIGECPDAEVTGCLKQLRKCCLTPYANKVLHIPDASVLHTYQHCSLASLCVSI